ncbi:hypothetical protein MHC_00875 [Mycoplasma haemocanis str. Illinois]|uniref:Uncharacterized protein n=1 Tax=Mycoplasma haemocanis (strain Illinois) TaxID=1111676 RepID=H6N5T1_MYCHN|nr:hypothetical protein [Mycoplasma haemocanis]AEW45041.1 hypothetical protein MHC_00875 [Mycoplasma haemocanis str. Illinois]
MNKLAGISVITGVAGVTGAGVFYLKPWNKKISVKQELQKLNKTILESTNDSRWEVKVHFYNTNISKHPHLKINDKNQITKEELSSWCSEVLKKSNSEDLHNKAKAWCLAPVVKDKLAKENKTILTNLNTKLQSYKSHNTNDNKVIPTTQIENKEKGNLSDGDFKKWCETYSESELLEGADENYERIVHWCTT